MVEYYLGGRLGHGMWSSVVGLIFGTVEPVPKHGLLIDHFE